MLLNILYPYMKFALGTLYPSYKTWKSLKRKDETIRRRWMKYWVSFGAFQMFELVADITLAFILPFYIELKLGAILWLVLGTKLIFDSIVNRELTKREKSIDRWLNRITKIRDELIAMIWYEVTRCSVKIFTTVMSGGLSVLVDKAPEQQQQQQQLQQLQQSNQASPICSDKEEEEEDSDHEQDKTVHYILEPDFNENMVSMEWSSIPAIDGTSNSTAKEPERGRSSSMVTVVRKSARRELKPVRSID